MENKIFKMENINKIKTQEYILLNQENELGVIALSKESFETIASITISEFKEVVFDEKSKHNAICKIKDNQLIVNCEVTLLYGCVLNNVIKMMQEKIHQNIVEMTNYKPDIINIKVVGFSIK